MGDTPRFLVLFDGVCGFCDRSVRFLLKIDRGGVLRFAPLQGTTAAGILERHGLTEAAAKTLILVTDWRTPEERVYVRSEAVLRILGALRGPWAWLRVLRLVPGPVRDGVYHWVARNRYRWFGRYSECRVPGAEVRGRFLP